MIKKLFSHAWTARHHIVKYVIIGFSTVALDVGTLVLFKEKLLLTPVLAVVFNQIIVLSYNFILNKYWTFQDKSMPHKQALRYLTIMAFNYVFSVGTMYYFNEVLGFDYRLVRIGSIAVVVMWNFILYKLWVFKKEEVDVV